jgi:hypothetical protein
MLSSAHLVAAFDETAAVFFTAPAFPLTALKMAFDESDAPGQTGECHLHPTIERCVRTFLLRLNNAIVSDWKNQSIMCQLSNHL